MGLVLAVLALRRFDPFQLFGAACMIALGVVQYLRPGPIALPFRDARVFVTDQTLTIDGRRIDVERVLRSDALEGPTVVVDVRGGPTVTILCPSIDERRALLRALGAPMSATYVFPYTPSYLRVLASAAMFVAFATVGFRLVHFLPAEIGWRPLWLLNLAVFMVVLPSRLELTKTELRVGSTIVPLRSIRVVTTEGAGISGVRVWLVIRHDEKLLRVLIPARLTELAARAVEKAVDRLRRAE